MRAARLLLAGALLVSVAACDGANEEVSGSVAKLDRMALSQSAVVTVELRDTSLADAPAETLSTDVIELGGNQLPVPYLLSYDPSDIDERHTYTVFSRIEDGGQLLYITDTAYPVITRGNPTEDVEVVVVRVGGG